MPPLKHPKHEPWLINEKPWNFLIVSVNPVNGQFGNRRAQGFYIVIENSILKKQIIIIQ